MNYTAISTELNDELCYLETSNYMVSLANKQMREARKRGTDERVVQFFDEKNEVYAQDRQNLISEIYYDYAKKFQSNTKKFEKAKEKLWDEFKKSYPNCNLNFEDVFKKNVAYYPPYVSDYNNRQKTDDKNSLDKAFFNYSQYAIEREQLLNFYELFGDVRDQVDEYGSEPFLEPKLSEKVCAVPIWAVREIAESTQGLIKKQKQVTLCEGVKLNQLRKILKKTCSAKEIENIKLNIDDLNEYVAQIEGFSKNTEELEIAVDNLFRRSNATNHKYTMTEARGMCVEKFLEFIANAPRDLKRYSFTKPNVYALQEEIDNIIALGKLYPETLEATLVLAMSANKVVELELFNYEYAKTVVVDLIKNSIENNQEKIKLETELKTDTKPQIITRKQQVIKEIEDCNNAQKVLRIQTPFGTMGIWDGKLFDIKTKQIVPVSKLQDYELEGETFKFVGEDKQVSKISLKEVEANLNCENKNSSEIQK